MRTFIVRPLGSRCTYPSLEPWDLRGGWRAVNGRTRVLCCSSISAWKARLPEAHVATFRFLPLLLGVLGTALTLHPSRAASADESNSLRGGSTAIQFLTFGGGYRSPFRTSGLYVRHHLSDRGALRVGVDFTIDESTGESPPGVVEPSVQNYRNYSIS